MIKTTESNVGKLTISDYQQMVNEYIFPFIEIQREIEDNGGEVTPDIEDKFNTLLLTYTDNVHLVEEATGKVAATGFYLKKLKSDIDFAKEQKAKADQYRKMLVDRNDRLRDAITMLMQTMGINKIKADKKTILSISEKPEVVIFDEELLTQVVDDFDALDDTVKNVFYKYLNVTFEQDLMGNHVGTHVKLSRSKGMIAEFTNLLLSDQTLAERLEEYGICVTTKTILRNNI